MAIPKYQDMMYPIMEIIHHQSPIHINEIIKELKVIFSISDEEMSEMLPSGKSTYVKNRAGWAVTYLKKARLLDSNKGVVNITNRGIQIVEDPSVNKLNNRMLKKYPEFRLFREGSKEKETKNIVVDDDVENDVTPIEKIFILSKSLNEELVSELIDVIKGCSPEFFEQLVVDLLVKMGYGGSVIDAGKAVGKSGDGGIDGIIKEDQLGLDVIYLQAKRWENVIGRPEIQKFVGALHGKHAKKGIFITTSDFTKDALDYVNFIENKIVLWYTIEGKYFKFKYYMLKQIRKNNGGFENGI